MATNDQLSKAIAPGSTEYGDRAALAEGLAAPAGQVPGLGPVAPPGAPSPMDEDLTPEMVLEQGPVSDLPVTSGLGVGPGEGPFMGIEGTTDQQRLQEMALNAPSALLRHMAAMALRRIHEKQQREL